MADSSARERWNNIAPALRACVEEVMGPPAPTELRDAPLLQSVPYATTDAIATRMLYPQLLAKVKEAGLERVLDIDMQTIPLADHIQKTGMLIDKQRFTELSVNLGAHITTLDQEMFALVRHEFNPDSPDQIADLLFSRLKVQEGSKVRLKKTAKLQRFVADNDALQALRHQHPIIPKLIERRELSKLKGTFADVLPTLADANGRIHTHLRNTRVPSGRFASHNPNLQQVPTRNEVAKLVRKCFVAPKGYVLCSIDLSGIEMVWAAQLSGDDYLCQLFNEGRDVHAETAARIFGKRVEDVDRATERGPCKSAGFLVLYGGTSLGLSEQLTSMGLKYDEKDAQKLIDDWYGVYKGVHQFVLSTHSEARLCGHVRDYFNRRIFVPQTRSTVRRIAEEGLRLAVNAKIQGSAAGTLRLAMIESWKVLKEMWVEGKRVSIIHTIHDELLLEASEELTSEIEARFKPCFENCIRLRVPVRAGFASASDWGSLEK